MTMSASRWLWCQKTFLISTLVDPGAGVLLTTSKDLFNFYSCRFNGVGLEVDGQKTFLISTLVDGKRTGSLFKVKRPF